MQIQMLVLAAVVAASPAPRPQTPESVIDRAAKAWARVTTARATFEQTVTNPLTGTTNTARGELITKKPGRFSLRFSDPAGDQIVGDGTYTWVYLPSSNPGQVIKLPTRTAPAGADIVDEILTTPRAKYTMADAGAATIGGRATRAVILTPREPKQFTKATVWIDDADGTVRQFELIEPTGLVRKVRLTSIKLNAKIPNSTFGFTPPKGVRVLDQRALGGG